MDGRGSRLAARFRKAVDDRAAALSQAQEAARAAAEDARAARQRVLLDLEAIARDIGVVEVSRPSGALVLRLGDRAVRFAPQGDGDRVDVVIDGSTDAEHWLYRQAELGSRWVYARRHRTRDDRVPLFDQGLEELLVKGLGLPKPADQPAEVPADSKRSL